MSRPRRARRRGAPAAAGRRRPNSRAPNESRDWHRLIITRALSTSRRRRRLGDAPVRVAPVATHRRSQAPAPVGRAPVAAAAASGDAWRRRRGRFDLGRSPSRPRRLCMPCTSPVHAACERADHVTGRLTGGAPLHTRTSKYSATRVCKRAGRQSNTVTACRLPGHAASQQTRRVGRQISATECLTRGHTVCIEAFSVARPAAPESPKPSRDSPRLSQFVGFLQSQS